MTYDQAYIKAHRMQDEINAALDAWDWRNDEDVSHITKMQQQHDAHCDKYSLPCERYATINAELLAECM